MNSALPVRIDVAFEFDNAMDLNDFGLESHFGKAVDDEGHIEMGKVAPDLKKIFSLYVSKYWMIGTHSKIFKQILTRNASSKVIQKYLTLTIHTKKSKVNEVEKYLIKRFSAYYGRTGKKINRVLTLDITTPSLNESYKITPTKEIWRGARIRLAKGMILPGLYVVVWSFIGYYDFFENPLIVENKVQIAMVGFGVIFVSLLLSFFLEVWDGFKCRAYKIPLNS